ncbi:MAG: hypothetical protein H7145_24140 [Akkermansiaceae bacterium]|nr:hypothetical protein [Armatimonadota bacterium]
MNETREDFTARVRANIADVIRRKQEMVDGLAQLYAKKVKTSGAELFMGEARFTAAKTVQMTLGVGWTRHIPESAFSLTSGAAPDVAMCRDWGGLARGKILSAKYSPATMSDCRKHWRAFILWCLQA